MAYSTVEQVQLIVVRDPNQDEGTGSSLPVPTIEDAIDEADREIDGKLRSIYTVPFNPVPALVSRISRDIAAYLSDLTFREVRDYQSDLNPILLRYKRAQDMLKLLVSGEMDLPSIPSAETNASGLIVAGLDDGGLLLSPTDVDIHRYHPVNRRTGWPPAGDWWGIW